MATNSTVPITGGSGFQINGFLEGTSSYFRQAIVIADPLVQGGAVPVGATVGMKVWFGADGVSIANFPATYPITPGASLNVGIIGNPTIANTGFNINGGSIANSGFGASVTNFPTAFGVSVSNASAIGGGQQYVHGVSNATNPTGTMMMYFDSVNSRYYAAGTSTPLPVNLQTRLDSINDSILTRVDVLNVQNGATTLPVQHAQIDVGTSAIVIAGVAGRDILVLKYSFTNGVSNILRWSNGVSFLSGPMPFGAPGGIAEPYTQVGILRSGVSRPLLLNLAAGGSVGGYLTYVIV